MSMKEIQLCDGEETNQGILTVDIFSKHSYSQSMNKKKEIFSRHSYFLLLLFLLIHLFLCRRHRGYFRDGVHHRRGVEEARSAR